MVSISNMLGVKAYGIDGSDFAVKSIVPSIKDRIFKVNLNSDPFPFPDKKFDLIGTLLIS